MKRAAFYLRVSTVDQTTANQERELREIAERMECDVVKVYKDHGVSGAKGRDKRPAFDALCRSAAQRKYDLVMAWSVDRLGRSLQDLVALLSELHALGIDLFLHQQGLDTTTPAGKAMFQMMGVFAEFERAMIQERVRAGLARAKSEGKRLGRPRIAPELEERIRKALATPGRPGVRKIAERATRRRAAPSAKGRGRLIRCRRARQRRSRWRCPPQTWVPASTRPTARASSCSRKATWWLAASALPPGRRPLPSRSIAQAASSAWRSMPRSSTRPRGPGTSYITFGTS